MAKLILIMPDGQRVISLAATNSVGRHPNNTIQVLDRIVSKEHCVIERRADGFWLRDLGSLNGTWINEQRVQGEQRLQHGDKILMGGTTAYYDDGRGLVGYTQPSPVPAVAPASPVPAVAQAAPVISEVPPGTAGRHAIPPRRRVSTEPLDHAAPGAVPSGVLEASRRIKVSHKTVAVAQFGTEGSTLSAYGKVDIGDQKASIGAQIPVQEKAFPPFDEIAGNEERLKRTYELLRKRLELSNELNKELSKERDPTKLLGKILQQLVKFVQADRGVILLVDEEDKNKLTPGASLSRSEEVDKKSIEISSTILNHVIERKTAVLAHNAQSEFQGSKAKSMILNQIQSALVVPLFYNEKLVGVLWLDAQSIGRFKQQDLEVAMSLGSQAAIFIENNNLSRQIEKEILTREQFCRLLSPTIADRVVSGELEVKKGGEFKENCTVFNSDIRGFTRMSSNAEPRTIVDMLNGYFELMVEVLFKHEGTLDKFMGDGLMALWGAPIENKKHAISAVACAIDQMKVLAEFNREREKNNQPPLGIGIGIHSGPLVAGYIGSSKSLSYTVIGDTVNTSARLCGYAKEGQILVSRQTYEQLEGKFKVEALEPAILKGKEKPVEIFNVIDRIK